jgi:polyisoprenyl-phosphate glycosyltransferase
VNIQTENIKSLQGPILVLGSSGFIGANLYKTIAEHRSDVFAVVRQEKGWRLSDVPDTQIIQSDVRDSAAVRNLIDNIRPKTVFNCIAYGAYSFEEEVSRIYETNFQSLIRLVEALSHTSIAAFVHAGSSSEYGTNSSFAQEDAFCDPNSHYSVSKIAAANYLRFMGKHHKFPSVHLRLYSVYGALEDTSRLIPTLLKNALMGTLPQFVRGDVSRDFVHVSDACHAFVSAALSISPSNYGEIFNVCSGNKTTIAELVAIARDAFNVQEEPRFGTMGDRKWDVSDWYGDPRKAKQQLDWTATTDLRAGLEITANWIRSLSGDAYRTFTKSNSVSTEFSVSAIVACYKDAQAIPHMYRRLTETFRRLGVDYEIIFVNDCSPDNSAEIIEAISATDQNVIGICHSRNFGSQMAFRSGMELSTKASVVLLDGDLQDPPELIEAFHKKWIEGFDVVYGRRVKREMSWYQELFYKAFYRVFAAFSYIQIPYDAGDFSLMSRRAVGWLLACTERDLFMRGLRAYVGFRQTGVDYVRPERMFGRSTNSFLKNISWAKRGIFSFSNTPLDMLTALGFALFLLSVSMATLAVLLKLFIPDVAPKGVTTLLISILFFGSLNLFAIGILGEYISKILTEVKRRPRLIRSALIRYGKTSDLLPDSKGR